MLLTCSLIVELSTIELLFFSCQTMHIPTTLMFSEIHHLRILFSCYVHKQRLSYMTLKTALHTCAVTPGSSKLEIKTIKQLFKVLWGLKMTQLIRALEQVSVEQ